ncbi:MAG: hypothetical protein R3A48_03415 [Polyangiales bacterium]
MRVALVVASLGLASLPARADPVPVHVAAVRAAGRSGAAANAERIAVADAVAEVIRGVTTDVLSATDTRTRLDALNPSAAHCDGLECITSITLPLHARALVLVRVSRGRDGAARVEARYVNLRGEVIAERAEQDLAPTTAELIALARLAAGTLAEAIRAREPAPVDPPAPAPVDPPAAPVAAPPTAPPTAPRPAQARGRRNTAEVIAGVAAITLGVGAVTVGTVGLTGSERVSQTLSDDRLLVERPSDLNWVWVGAGAAAVGAGVFLLVDGLRPRRVPVAAAVTPIPSGAMLTASGRF